MAGVIAIDSRLKAQFVVLSLAPPSIPQIPFGILLFDPRSGSLKFKFREDIDALGLTPEDEEYASFLQADFDGRAGEMSAAELLASLEDSLSGFVRISEREAVSGRTFERMLDRLFDAHVVAPLGRRIQPHVTHLPFYGLRAAATKFGEDMEVSHSDVEWVRIPPGVRPSPDLFVVRVVGRSMEPLIADGSLAVFRHISVGSRQGKRLLIEELGVTDTSARFTVKKYSSVKRARGEDEWEHAAIRLEPLNPEFSAFELDPESFENRYRVIGEFVTVLPFDDDLDE